MAVDEAIVQTIGDSDQPILRFYDWSEPSISIGYSQRVGEVLKVELCKKEGIPIVRRPTGGGVVFHGVDITYSLVLPKGFSSNIQDTFLWIQSNIKNGLLSLGINTVGYGKKEKASPSYCFTTPNIGDLMEGNRKLSGLAGRRMKGKVLCQGYIYFDDASSMVKLVKGLKSLNKAVSIQEILGEGVTPVRGRASNGVTRNTIKEIIIRNWPHTFIRDTLDAKEEQLAGTLCETKYSQDEWNCRR